MKKVLTILFLLCFLQGVKAEANLRVTDMRCEPGKVMSGEWFHLYFTVENLSEEPVSTNIFLYCRSAPDGFWGYNNVPLYQYEINLPAFGKEEIDHKDCFTGKDDELFELYFLTETGELISDYCPLQFGECGNEVLSVELSIIYYHLTVGRTDSDLAWVRPGSAPQQVIWTVTNPDVIKILEYYDKGDQGVIFEAIGAGETDLIVTAVGGLSATAHIIVDPEPVRAESITLNTYEITGVTGDTFQLEAFTLPENNDAVVVFNSGNEKVATVGMEDGLVTITGTGTTEIYAWATPGVGMVQAICTVTGVTAGVDDVEADVDEYSGDVYRIDGTLIFRGASVERINELPKGCYILRSPDRTVKIIR